MPFHIEASRRCRDRFLQRDRHHGGDHHSCKCIEVVVRPLGRLHQHAHAPPPGYVRLCPRGQCIYSTQHKIAAPCGTWRRAPVCGSTTSVSLCGTRRAHACPDAVTGSAPSFLAMRSMPGWIGMPSTFGMPRHAHAIAGWQFPVAGFIASTFFTWRLAFARCRALQCDNMEPRT